MSISNPVFSMAVSVVFPITELALLYGLSVWFVPSLLLPSHACLLTFSKHQYPFYFSVTHTHTVFDWVFSTPLISLSPSIFHFYLHASPICIYFSVDGDLSRPWLMLAQPPPPLCSLWWWGSLCCDTDAGSADRATDWNRLTWVVNLGKGRGQKGW